jgi:hypothetical protein
MLTTPQKKLKIVLLGMATMTALTILNPFLISSDIGLFSRSLVQATLAVAEFLIIAYLWNQFNNLRVILNKKELEDERLEQLEKHVEKVTHMKL